MLPSPRTGLTAAAEAIRSGGASPVARGCRTADPDRVDDKECVLVRKLLSSLGLAVVLSMVGLGAGAVSAAAADPVADLRAFVEAGFHGTTDAEYRAWAEVLATSTDGPTTRQAATDALAVTPVSKSIISAFAKSSAAPLVLA